MTLVSELQQLKCSKCHQLKDIENFRKYKYKGEIRYRYECRSCVSKYNAEYHALVMSIPYCRKRREESKRISAKNSINKKKESTPDYQEKERQRHKEYRKRLAGKYFIIIDPILPTVQEALNLYGLEDVAEITGFSQDFIYKINHNKYNVVRADIADVLLVKLHGPSFAYLYPTFKRYYIDDNHGRFRARRLTEEEL